MERNGKFNWLSFLVGIIFIIASIFILKNPETAILTLTISFGIIAIARGIMLIVAYSSVKELTTLKLKISLTIGILFVIIGIVLLAWPEFAARAFAYLVAVGFIADAFNNLINSSFVRPAGRGMFSLWIICSILLLVSGILLLLNPKVFGLTVTWFVGLSLIISGIDYIIFAFSYPKNLYF